MRPIQDEIKSVRPKPFGNDLARDISRIERLIRRRLGKCSDEVSTLVSEVLPYHLYAAATGLHDSVEEAALSLGEEMRIGLSQRKRF
jgi:hypothetical protein